MKPAGYYTSGQFAKMAHISVRTVRFYDKQNILKPSYVSPAGSRFYTDQDFARLQQILLLKYLGFSLEDIKEMTRSWWKRPLKILPERSVKTTALTGAICWI